MENYIAFCHKESEILAFANLQLKNSGSKTKLVEITNHSLYGDHIEFKTNRGAKVVAVIFRYSAHQIAFRSILKVIKKNARATWMFNGQPHRNMTALVFNGENGAVLRAPIDRFIDCVYKSIKNPSWTEKDKQDHCKREREWAEKNELHREALTLAH